MSCERLPQELFVSQNFGQRKKTVQLIRSQSQAADSDIVDTYWVEYIELVMNAHHRSHIDTKFHSIKLIPSNKKGYFNFCCTYTKDGKLIKDDIVGSTGALSATKKTAAQLQKTRMLSAMRNSLIEEHNNIRKSRLQESPYCCICGCKVSYESSHLDHTGEHEFKDIAEIFFNTYESFPVNNGSGIFGCDEFVDVIDKTKWLSVHNNYVELQLTCIKCNLTKKK